MFPHSTLIIAFVTLVVLGGILLPAVTIFRSLLGLSWDLPAFLTIIFLLLSLILSRYIEREKRAQKIRNRVQSKSGWMSLADFGASYGRLEIKKSKRKVQVNMDDRWSYLREILSNSNSLVSRKKIKPRSK